MDAPLGLFEGFGIEIELMIVGADDLDVRPLAEQLLIDEDGALENEVEHGDMAWSNELAAHVIEFKTNGPVPSLVGLAARFRAQMEQAEKRLAEHGARLLPTGMHPWMDPSREFTLWRHDGREVYEAFDRIFECRGHGWSNLQSVHLNLPFRDDAEFGRLHAAARALLPLLPALAASSPLMDGRHHGALDQRLEVYRGNARRVPSVSGQVVPEAVFDRAAYEALLEGVYRDLAPLDPAGTLRHEWVNARGCIARFDRMAIEIRVLDVQEMPEADLAIAALVTRVARGLCDPNAQHQARLRALPTDGLAALFQQVVRLAGDARVEDPELLAALGLDRRPRFVRDLWYALSERYPLAAPEAREFGSTLDALLGAPCLARRILDRTGPEPDRATLLEVYREIADASRAGRLFGIAT